MRSHRTITSKTIFLALALVCALPATAGASSLLSGYGGPGQGNQAILGSGVVNGPTGGGGGTGGSTSLEATSGATASGGGRGSSQGGRASANATKRVTRSAARSSAGGTQASPSYTSPHVQTASRSSATGANTLGLSGADLAYILVALAVLALTGVLTMRLARRPRQAGTSAKGIPRRTRLTE